MVLRPDSPDAKHRISDGVGGLGWLCLRAPRGPSVIAWLRAKKIGDLAQSNHRDLDALTQEKSGTPTMGGILIVGALMLSVLLFADLRELGALRHGHHPVFGLAGGFDDWLKLTAGKREGSRDGLRMWRSSSSNWACLS